MKTKAESEFFNILLNYKYYNRKNCIQYYNRKNHAGYSMLQHTGWCTKIHPVYNVQFNAADIRYSCATPWVTTGHMLHPSVRSSMPIDAACHMMQHHMVSASHGTLHHTACWITRHAVSHGMLHHMACYITRHAKSLITRRTACGMSCDEACYAIQHGMRRSMLCDAPCHVMQQARRCSMQHAVWCSMPCDTEWGVIQHVMWCSIPCDVYIIHYM